MAALGSTRHLTLRTYILILKRAQVKAKLLNACTHRVATEKPFHRTAQKYKHRLQKTIEELQAKICRDLSQKAKMHNKKGKRHKVVCPAR